MRCTLAVLIGTTLVALPRLEAQDDWTSVHQPATWVNAFVDHAVTPRTALWFDAQVRRMDLGAPPQQVLVRPGVQFSLGRGVRVGGGYAWIATAPYGGSPNPRPVREHRAWQQVSLAQRAGSLSLSHRLRWEQRWNGIVQASDDLAPFIYQQRLRYAVRAQRPLSDGRDELVFIANEFFLPVGHSDAEQRRLQNRAHVGVGVPLASDARQRLEVGYLHQWNRITPRTTHEHNHTLVVSWVWTARR